MSRRDEVVAGVFVIVGVAVIVAAALWLSESRWRGEFETLQARLPSVGRLKPGNPVTLRGVQVGQVERIEVAEPGVDVALRVRADIPLPDEPVVVAHPVTLFGEWAVSLEPLADHAGARSDTLSRPEGALPGVTASDFAQLAEYSGQIASNLESITDRVELAFNEETARNFARAVENFEQASDELVALLARQRESFGGFAEDMASAGRTLQGVAADLDTTVRRLEAATAEGELEAILDNARSATASLDRVSGQLEGTAAGASRAIARADSALRRAEAILARVEEGRGSLGRLANDPALYEDLAATLRELQVLLDDLKRNPGKYFKFSIF